MTNNFYFSPSMLPGFYVKIHEYRIYWFDFESEAWKFAKTFKTNYHKLKV